MTPREQEVRLDGLQQRIGCRFRDSVLLEMAMTHSSVGAASDNERLEFLGDRVLNLVMAQELYERFPHEVEGDLAQRHAALVQAKILATVARRISLGEALLLSAAERAAGGADNENILADGMEALLGALFLDAGFEECRRVICAQWGEDIYTLQYPPRDAKTALQEWAQARDLGLPDYQLISREGPDHAPLFEIEVTVGSFPPARAIGGSRRKAEKDAASILLARLEGAKS